MFSGRKSRQKRRAGRPGMHLSFGQQALLLVSVPLVFELVFVGSLAIVLNKVEVEKNYAEQSRDLVLAAQNLTHSLYEVGQALFLYGSTRSKFVFTVYQQRLATSKDNLAVLQELLHKSGRYSDSSSKIDLLGSQLLELLDVVGSSMSQSAIEPTFEGVDSGNLGGFVARHSSILFDSTVLDQVAFDTKLLTNQLKLVDDAERKRSVETPKTAASLRQLLGTLFWLGVLGNILLAIGLTVYFDRRTTSRLKILVNNTDRLAHGQSLLPEFGGHDEIAQLDTVFHQMAVSLGEATERMRSIVDYMPLGLVTATPQGLIDSVNPRMEQYAGYASEDLVGKPLTMLFVNTEGADPAAFLNDLQDKVKSRSVEMTACKASGEIFPVQLSCSEFKISGGVRWLITLEDVTEIREMQRLKQEFTAIISHELRTPLTSVKAFLSGFSMGVYGEMKEGLLKRVGGIQSSVERLIRLINDLLDSEKMAAGMLTVVLSPLEFEQVLTVAMHSVRELAEKQKVNIAIEPCAAQVNGDHDRLVQVMVNLLSNAIKYSPAGGDIKVSIRQDGEYVQVAVSDQGSGIAKDSQALIFERFHQVDPLLSKRQGGTGLGLFLCKYLVEKHGGTIGVTSELGKGSTFWFRLAATS